MTSMTQLSRTMQTLLTTTADELAQTTGFMRRKRKLTGAVFAQTLVLGRLAQPQAPLEQLAQTAVALGVPVSRQAIDQRCTQAGAAFLRALLETAIGELVEGEPVAIPLLRRFGAVAVLDSTTIALPASLAGVWRGCGGSTPKAGAAAVKLQVRFDLVCGRLEVLALEHGRDSDQTAPSQTAPLTPGALRLSDLGFFSVPVLRRVVAAGGHFLCRPKARTMVWDANGRRWRLRDLLATHCRQDLDLWVTLGTTQRMRCRLVAQRLPPAVAEQRRQRLLDEARRDGTQASPAQLALTPWAVFVTDLAADQLTLAEALVLARLRWQIELLFKCWKSQGAIDEPRSDRSWPVLCALYAKLLAVVIQHWLLLVTCWEFPAKSLVQAAQTIRVHAMRLVDAFAHGSRRRLREALATIADCLAHGCKMSKRRKRPHAYQLALAFTEEHS